MSDLGREPMRPEFPASMAFLRVRLSCLTKRRSTTLCAAFRVAAESFHGQAFR